MIENTLLPETLTLPPRTITGPGMVSRLLEEAVVFGRSGVLVHGGSLEKDVRCLPDRLSGQ